MFTLDPNRLYLGKVIQYTLTGAILEVSEYLKPVHGFKKVGLTFQVEIEFKQGLRFGISTHEPEWSDEHLNGSVEMPASQDILVVADLSRKPTNLLRFDAAQWGYYNHYLEVENDIKNLPQFRLLVKKKGGYEEKILTNDLEDLRDAASAAFAEISQGGSTSYDRLKAVLRLIEITNEGKNRKEVSFEEMKSLLRIT